MSRNLKLSAIPEGFHVDEDDDAGGIYLPVEIRSMDAWVAIGICDPPFGDAWVCGLSLSLYHNKEAKKNENLFAITPLTKRQIRQLADALYQVLADS